MNDTTTPTTAIPISNTGAPAQNETASQTPSDVVNGAKEDTPLFSSLLISAEVTSQLPDGYSIRPLRKSDYHGGESVLSEKPIKPHPDPLSSYVSTL